MLFPAARTIFEPTMNEISLIGSKKMRKKQSALSKLKEVKLGQELHFIRKRYAYGALNVSTRGELLCKGRFGGGSNIF